MNNREKFLTLVFDNELDRSDVAEMLKVDRDQVDHWMISPESARHEDIPDMAIELLELKLKLREESQSG
ncbi:MAG: hypothetical protein U5P41_06375 [Gammaproteobacteria bacterium]|nr:hypothetical protein [Gammaproteobacteria bacterium]